MIKVLNILLFLLCAALGYFLVMGIVNPLKYKKQVETRESAVHARLLKIRDSQEAFRSVHDKFAPDFDTLIHVLKNDNFETVNRFTGDTIRVSIADSLFKGDMSAISELPNVPYSDSKFSIDAGVLPSPTDSTLYVPVFEANTYTDKFLEGVDKGFWKTGKKVKVGSMTAPITTGNWE